MIFAVHSEQYSVGQASTPARDVHVPPPSYLVIPTCVSSHAYSNA